MTELEFEAMIEKFASDQAAKVGKDEEDRAVFAAMIVVELRALGSQKFIIKTGFIRELSSRCIEDLMVGRFIAMIDFQNKTVVELAAALDKFCVDKGLCSNPITAQAEWAKFAEPYESELVKLRRERKELQAALLQSRAQQGLRSQGTFPDTSSGNSGPPSPSLKV